MLASAYLSLSLLFASALALGSSGHDRTPLDLAAKSRRLAKRNTKRQGTCAAKYTNSKSINGIAGLKRPTAFVARSGNTGLAVSGKAYRPVGPSAYAVIVAQGRSLTLRLAQMCIGLASMRTMAA
jgi:hypothetical protein